MTAKRTSRLNSALVPLGVVAIVAGCGGGSAVSNSNGTTTYLPPSGPHAMTAAQLLVTIPARGPKLSGVRNPKFISGGAHLLVTQVVPSPYASPWPSPSMTALPSPGPSPTTFPVSIQVPVGTDLFVASTYDGQASCCQPTPAPTPTGYLLGQGSTTAAVALNQTNSVNISVNGVAQCLQVNGSYSTTVHQLVLENQTQPQSTTLSVVPCDHDGYAITGPLANTVSLGTPTPGPTPSPCQTCRVARHPKNAAPPGLSFSPSTISTGGTTPVTVTYPAGAATQLAAYTTYSPPVNTFGFAPYGYTQFVASPDYLILVTNAGTNSVSVIDEATMFASPGPFAQVSLAGSPTSIAAGSPWINGCAGAAVAVVAHGGYSILTEPTPAPGATSLPTPTVFATIVPFSQHASSTAIDGACGAYLGDDQTGYGYLATVAAPAYTPPPTGSQPQFPYNSGYPSVGPLAISNGSVYAAIGSTGMYGMYANNIATTTTFVSSGVGYGRNASAIAPFYPGIAAAFPDPAASSTPTYHVALIQPTGSSVWTPSSELDTGQTSPVRAMAYDPFCLPYCSAWLVYPGALRQYTPGSGGLSNFTYTGSNPTAIAVGEYFNGGASMHRSLVYVADGTDDKVYVFDSNAPATPIATIILPAGSHPSGIAIAP